MLASPADSQKPQMPAAIQAPFRIAPHDEFVGLRVLRKHTGSEDREYLERAVARRELRCGDEHEGLFGVLRCAGMNMDMASPTECD